MFIDIHVHSGLLPDAPCTGLKGLASPEELLVRYDELGVEQAVLLPIVSPEAMCATQSTVEILAIRDRHPGRFIPFCNVDPRAVGNSPASDLSALIGLYKERGCKGCGEVTASLPFTDPMVFNLFRTLEAADLPVTFHIAPAIGGYYGLYDHPGLPLLDQALTTFPRLRFFGHSPAFWAEIGRLRKPGDRCGYPAYPVESEGALPWLMRQHSNLYGDLSAGSGFNALARDPVYAATFLEAFQDRLFFGTDITAPDTPTPLVDFLLRLRDDGKISESVFQKIARDNATRELGLPTRGVSPTNNK